MKIAVASDHGGYNYKKIVLNYLKENKYDFIDFGSDSLTSCDYPDFALKAAKAIVTGECDLGILICGTGIGMSISANKVKGIRAGVCSDVFSAKMARAHNNANILALGERVIGAGLMLEILDAFLKTKFEKGIYLAVLVLYNIGGAFFWKKMRRRCL